MILFFEILLMIVAVSQEPFTLTEDSWISPEINLIEEEVLDPYEYVTPDYYIGHIVYVDTENGEKWQATLVGTDEVCLLLEGGEPEYIPYSFEVDQLKFSPDGRFVLFYDLLADSCGLLDTSTHDFTGFRTGLPEDSGFPIISISNTGSTVFTKHYHVSIRDSNGESVALITGFSGGRLMEAKISNSGSMIVISESRKLTCLDEYGELLWEKDVTFPEGMGRLRIAQFVFSDEGDKLLYSSAHSIHVIDTDTGNTIWSDTSPMFTSFSQISPSGEIWSFGLFEAGRNDPGSYSKTEIHFISTYPLSFNNIATYFNTRIYHPQTIAFICALSNAKLHLCGFAGGSSVQGYKFALVTTEGITLWLSEWFSPGRDQISTQYYYNRIGMINRDGSRFFYTDGSLIHFYRIEVL